jgi:hypothetical protein
MNPTMDRIDLMIVFIVVCAFGFAAA